MIEWFTHLKTAEITSIGEASAAIKNRNTHAMPVINF